MSSYTFGWGLNCFQGHHTSDQNMAWVLSSLENDGRFNGAGLVFRFQVVPELCACKIKPNSQVWPRGTKGAKGAKSQAPPPSPHGQHMPRHALEGVAWLPNPSHMPTLGCGWPHAPSSATRVPQCMGRKRVHTCWPPNLGLSLAWLESPLQVRGYPQLKLLASLATCGMAWPQSRCLWATSMCTPTPPSAPPSPKFMDLPSLGQPRPCMPVHAMALPCQGVGRGVLGVGGKGHGGRSRT